MEGDNENPTLVERDEVRKVTSEGAHNEDNEYSLRSSPILITPRFGAKFQNATRRRNKLRGSGSVVPPGPSTSLPVPQSLDFLENLKTPPMSPCESFVMSQDCQPNFLAPGTPAHKIAQPAQPSCGSDSDDDIFASFSCSAPGNEVMPTALNALLGGTDPVDVSWTSSMATPLTSNLTCSKLNTEERRVLLPSEDCSFAVRPRALFSPDPNDSADCQLLNNSSDPEYLQACRGENGDKTPKFIKRKLSCLVESPLAACAKPLPPSSQDAKKIYRLCLGQSVSSPKHTGVKNDLDSSFASPNQKHNPARDQVLDSPILSGNSDFANSPNQTKLMTEEDEDLFGNTEESFNDIVPCSQPSSIKDRSVAGSTPKTDCRKKSPSIELHQSTTPKTYDNDNNIESFLQDISVTALEEICQAEERTASLLPTNTPEKQSDTKRKRLLFSSVSNLQGGPSMNTEVKAPEINSKAKATISDKTAHDDCIPDDSFMEHMAAMNNTIFSDNVQPAIRVQSIKSSCSHIKKFSYTADPVSDGNSFANTVSDESKTLMKEILSSTIAQESAHVEFLKPKSVKPSKELVAFSKLLEGTDNQQAPGDEDHLKSPCSGFKMQPVCTKSPVNPPMTHEEAGILSVCDTFQTASGNSIKLSQEAIRKGLNVLKGALEEDGTSSEGTENVLSGLLSDLSKVEAPTAPKATTKSGRQTAPTAPTVTFEGIQNGSDLSDDQMLQAAEEVKQLMQLVNNGEDFNPWHEMEQPHYPAQDSTSVASQDEIPKQSQFNIRKDSRSEEETAIAEDCPPFSGFATASGRIIEVSEEQLAKAKKILCDLEEESPDVLLKNFKSTKTHTKVKDISESCVEHSSSLSIDKEACIESDVPKFSIESNCQDISSSPMKEKAIQEGASKSLKRKIEQISCQDDSDRNKTADTNIVLSPNKKSCLHSPFLAQDASYTPHEKDVALSSSNPSVPDHLKENMSCKADQPIGFTTASGRTVNISEKALLKVQGFFDDLSVEPFNESKGKFGSATSDDLSSKCSSVANNQYESSNRKTMKEIDSVHSYTQMSQLKSNLKANVIEVESAEFSSDRRKSVNDLKHVNWVKSHCKDQLSQSGNVTKELFDFSTKDAMVNQESFMVGFSTANGKTVSVSEKALQKAKALLNDITTESAHQVEGSMPSSVMKEKSCSLSENNALHHVSKEVLPSSDHIHPGDIDWKTPCGVFSTANGKSVSVSKQALQKAKSLFANISDESSGTSKIQNSQSKSDHFKEITGFSTASGNLVKISDQALRKSKNLFDDLLADPICKAMKKHESGSLVPGEDVSSEDSKTVLQDSNSYGADKSSQDLSFMKGFSTASGKTVSVSEKALRKVKGLFDLDDSSIDSPVSFFQKDSSLIPSGVPKKTEKISCESPSNSVPMAGFSTAGGKTVNVSKEALAVAKNILGDLESEFANVKEDNNLGRNNKTLMTQRAVQDDSGVFMSCENTQIKLSSAETSSLSYHSLKVPGSKSYASCANKENKNTHGNTPCETNQFDLEKASLTQEVTASTAAFLADEFSNYLESSNIAENYLATISTSPSMLTDRVSYLKPVLSSSSSSEEYSKLPEPTSPILVKNESAGLRRKLRRGRLSLATTVTPKSSSLTFDTPSVTSSQISCAESSSSQHFKDSTGNVASFHSSLDASGEKGEISSSSCDKMSALSDVKNKEKISPKLSSSRKLFDNEASSSPSKEESCNTKLIARSSLKSDSKTPVNTALSRNSNIAGPSNQTPLMRKTLTRNVGSSSGFKTPFKSSSKESQKRCSLSPAHDPPQAKQRKTSDNLYVSHIYFTRPESDNSDSRSIRPEVAEMRRRAAKEQKQLVENFLEEKGELLRPCKGSWLARKNSSQSSQFKLIQMMEIEQPNWFPPSKLLRVGLKASTLQVTAANSQEFRFSSWDFYSGDTCRENVAGLPVGDGAFLILDNQGLAGVEEFERAFLASPGVDPGLVPTDWVRNHYRWLVWKLAAMEWRFPHQFGGRCLTPHILMLQLKYRYDREIDCSERPALRRILELDDSAAKRMVLCVASILNLKDANQGSSGTELELTDGWYSVAASIDQDMQHRVAKGVIVVGTKLIMHGAELVNCPEGCNPLQIKSDVRLKLCSNSCRRARWYAKLGFQDTPGPVKISLGSILSSGGVVSCVSAYVARVYPVIFMEKRDEKTVVRSQRAESKEVAKSERKRQQLTEVVYGQVQAEIQQEQIKLRRTNVKFSKKNLSTILSGEELTEILESSSDPSSVQNLLTEEQKGIISEYQRYKQEEVCRDMEARVRLKLSGNSNSERQVTPILKIRLCTSCNTKQTANAILSIWRPSEDMASIFKEGSQITIFSAVASGLRYGDLQLSANRSTRFQANNSPVNPNLLRCVSPLSSLSSRNNFSPPFGELDLVGLVIRISSASQTSENSTHVQTIYLSDLEQNFVAVTFWGGLKELGVEDLIMPHTYIAASNLQWRGAPVVKIIPCVYANELSLFSTNPRQPHLKTAMQELRQSLTTDLKAYCRECEDKLDNILSQKVPSSNASPRTPVKVLKSTKNSSPKEEAASVQNEPPLNVPSHQSSPIIKAQQKLSLEHKGKTPSSPTIEKSYTLLERHAKNAPPMSPITIAPPGRSLRKGFKAPRRTDSPTVGRK